MHRSAVNIEAVRRYLRMSHDALAELTGMTRTAVQARCTGVTTITAPELDRFADALGIDTSVLLLDDERDALRWALDYGRKVPVPLRSRWGAALEPEWAAAA